MSDPAVKDVPVLFSSRFFITTMCFLDVFFMVTARLNMSVAILCMVNHTAINSIDESDLSLVNRSVAYYMAMANDSNDSNDTSRFPINVHRGDQDKSSSRASGCAAVNASQSEDQSTDGPFLWTKQDQGTVLGAYYWGYLLSQIPSGWVVGRLGSVRMLGTCTLLSSVFCLLVPALAPYSYMAVAILRACTGFVAGPTCPAVHNLLSNWLPPTERAKMVSYAYSGYPVGSLVAFTGSGLLCKYGFAGGWQSIFYVYGGASLVFAISWWFFVSEKPTRHKFISAAEKRFIERHVQELLIKGGEKKNFYTPWKSLLTSLPVHAILLAGIAQNFYGIIMWLFLPMYLSEVMNYDILSNGILSSVPYVVQSFVGIGSGWLSDTLLQKKMFSIRPLRKIFCCTGFLICCISLITMGFIGCQQASLAVVLLSLALGAFGLMTNGYFVNPMDIAPAYSGLIIAMANTAGTPTGLVSPYIVSAITETNPAREAWPIIFFMSAAAMAGALIFFAIFADGNVQPWALRELSGSPDKSGLDIEEEVETGNREDTENSKLNRESMINPLSSISAYCSPENGLLN